MADGFSLGQCQCSLWSLAGVGSVTHGGAPGCSSRTLPLQPLAAKALPCRAHALCQPGTAVCWEFQPSVPLHQSRDLLQGWAAQLGPAGNLHRVHSTTPQAGLNPSSQQLQWKSAQVKVKGLLPNYLKLCRTWLHSTHTMFKLRILLD